jgi:hypothetical protein
VPSDLINLAEGTKQPTLGESEPEIRYKMKVAPVKAIIPFYKNIVFISTKSPS